MLGSGTEQKPGSKKFLLLAASAAVAGALIAWRLLYYSSKHGASSQQQQQPHAVVAAADSAPRFVIKLSRDCTLSERCTAKELAAAQLGGEGALRAIEEDGAPVVTLIALETSVEQQQQQQQKKSVVVVGFGILKAGVHDRELESLSGELERFIRREKEQKQQQKEEKAVDNTTRTLSGRKSSAPDNDDDDSNSQLSSEALAKAQSLARGSSILGGVDCAPLLIGEAMQRIKRSSSSNAALKKKGTSDSFQRRLISAEVHSLAVHPAYRGKKLGQTIANLLGNIAANNIGVFSIQGTAANADLVPFYEKHCAPPVLQDFMTQHSQYFTLDATAPAVKAELRARWEKKLPIHIKLDDGLREMLIAEKRLALPLFGAVA